jgi:predicted Rossmann fold flavoprotein
MRKVWDVALVGAGPAGLFAALTLANFGVQVLLLERQERLGGKLPYSGGGRGNLTHAGEIEELLAHYHGGKKEGAASRFLRPALFAFSNRDLARFFEKRGLPLVADSQGRLFPKTGSAQDALRILIEEAEKIGLPILLGTKVEKIRRGPSGFALYSQSSKVLGRAWAVVLATGGPARPDLGGSADGYALAESLGHRIVPPRPALAPVIVKPQDFSSFVSCVGLALRGTTVTLFRARKVRIKVGDALFTHRGLSGPAILDLSRDVEPGDLLRVALAPELGAFPEAERRLRMEAASLGRKNLVNFLCELGLPRSLSQALLISRGVSPAKKAAELTRDERRALAESLARDFGLPFPVAAVGGWEEAMVTRGGVDLDEVDPKTMGSRLVPGLFFAGEILDIDGESGGYNLQAAFSTGYLAGVSAARFALHRGQARAHSLP